MTDVRLIHGSALHIPLDDESVQCVVTSPPYWVLRQYAGEQREVWGGDAGCAHEWGAGSFCACGAWYGALGLEPTPELYVEHIVEVFREVRRVLRRDGTLWLNLSSSYASGGTSPIPSRPHSSAPAYGSDGTERADLSALDSAYSDLCDGCRVALSSRTVRSDRPTPESSLPSKQTGRDIERLGSAQASPVVSPLASLVSTTGESAPQLPGECSHCGNCGACLSVLRSSSRDARLCVRMAGYTLGTSSLVSASRTADKDALGMAWLNYTRALGSKQLVPIPWMVAMALQQDGWYLRSDIIWHKPNPMPESVTDRPTKSHEYLFLLTKSERYYYDADAIREAAAWERWGDQTVVKPQPGTAKWIGNAPKDELQERTTRNKRTVWTIATRPYKGAHFATFPPDLVEPCVLAGSSPKACGVCGAPWERVTERSRATFERGIDPTLETGRAGMNRERPGVSDRYVLAVSQREVAAMLCAAARGREPEMRERFGSKWDHWTRTDSSGARIPTFEDATALRDLLDVDIPFNGEPGGWRSTCEHKDDSGACVVLDPFNGSGTTGQVAVRLGRSYVGVDISKEYLEEQAVRRIYDVQMEAAL